LDTILVKNESNVLASLSRHFLSKEQTKPGLSYHKKGGGVKRFPWRICMESRPVARLEHFEIKLAKCKRVNFDWRK